VQTFAEDSNWLFFIKYFLPQRMRAAVGFGRQHTRVGQIWQLKKRK